MFSLSIYILNVNVECGVKADMKIIVESVTFERGWWGDGQTNIC